MRLDWREGLRDKGEEINKCTYARTAVYSNDTTAEVFCNSERVAQIFLLLYCTFQGGRYQANGGYSRGARYQGIPFIWNSWL